MSVLLPKLKRGGDFWWNGDPTAPWLWDEGIPSLFELGDAKAIQLEVSAVNIEGWNALWFRGLRQKSFGGTATFLYWAETHQQIQGHNREMLCYYAAETIRKHFKIGREPKMLYVRLWLLTGEDAKGD